MNLEKRLKFYDAGTISYAQLKSLQSKWNQELVDGTREPTLIAAQVTPEIEFGANDDRNLFSESGRAYLRQFHGVDSPYATAEIVELLAKAKPRGLSVSRAGRAGGSTIVTPGQYLYFPVIALPGRDASESVAHTQDMITRIMSVMQDVSRQFIPADRVALAPLGTSKSISMESYDLAHVGHDKLYKLGSKGIRLGRYSPSAGGISRTMVEGGFVFHAESGSIKNFDLIHPCGIPLEKVGVTSFEHVLGRRIPKAEFDTAVYDAAKKHFYD